MSFRGRFGVVAPTYLTISSIILIEAQLGILPNLLGLSMGIILSSIIPGHIFLALLMPGILKYRYDNQNDNERSILYLYLIPVTSISITSGVGLILAFLGHFSEEKIVSTMFLFCVIGVFLTFSFRSDAVDLYERVSEDIGKLFNMAPMSGNNGLSPANLVLFLSLITLFATMIEKTETSEELTEIYITGTDGSLEGIPSSITLPSENFEILVGINHRGSSQTFEIEEVIYFIRENSSETEMESVYYEKRVISLDDGNSYTYNFSHPLEETGEYRIEFNLIQENIASVHRSVHFYLEAI